MTLTSCKREIKYSAVAGKYLIECEVDKAVHSITVDLLEDGRMLMSFSKESAMRDWYYEYLPQSRVLKRGISPGEVLEVDDPYVKMIFELVYGDDELVSDVSHKRVDGRDVSILSYRDGRKVHVYSKSSVPFRLEYGNMSAEIVHFPSALGELNAS